MSPAAVHAIDGQIDSKRFNLGYHLILSAKNRWFRYCRNPNSMQNEHT